MDLQHKPATYPRGVQADGMATLAELRAEHSLNPRGPQITLMASDHQKTARSSILIPKTSMHCVHLPC
eukprot:1056990-Pelagomonas_calceolata.AAC.8